ncbi:TetR/AcrR family transcriptional regulator [Lysinibacillus sp. 54212]|uniref:TetR/AcrR family transcriptional regulator n=1 Tax=Lysinibacillus sp. 54212 TaxID=3119829 RepID=UPI002FC951AD
MNKRKKMVVDHALSLFVEKGLQQTSIQDIIERAGISKGTFYNYFSSKNECVEGVLEQARYDAALTRAELMIGKNSQDIDILIEQITVISSINRNLGLDVVFEEILHSGDMELKKVVLKYRVLELDWLAERLTEVFGEELRENAFEAAVLFAGMMQHIVFMSKLIHQNTLEMKNVATSIMNYMKVIVEMMIHGQNPILDYQNITVFRASINKHHIEKKDLLQQIDKFSANSDFTKAQKDIIDAIKYEMELEEPRESVTNALLQAFINEFKSTPFIRSAKEVSSMVWYYMKHK